MIAEVGGISDSDRAWARAVLGLAPNRWLRDPVLDTGALIALERRDKRMLALLDLLVTECSVAFAPLESSRKPGAVEKDSTPLLVCSTRSGSHRPNGRVDGIPSGDEARSDGNI